MVGWSDINVHTYKSMQNPKYSDGRDLFPVVFSRAFFIPKQKLEERLTANPITASKPGLMGREDI